MVSLLQWNSIDLSVETLLLKRLKDGYRSIGMSTLDHQREYPIVKRVRLLMGAAGVVMDGRIRGACSRRSVRDGTRSMVGVRRLPDEQDDMRVGIIACIADARIFLLQAIGPFDIFWGKSKL